MEYFKINGGTPLRGSVNISGAKNAALAIIPAALLATGVSVIENLPEIEDIYNLINIVENLGAKCKFENNTLTIDTTHVDKYRAVYETVKKIRASYYLLGALLSRFKQAEVAMPGGCNFGQRPIDLHLKGFSTLGARVELDGGMIQLAADELIGKMVYMDVVSVGATINVMLASTLAEGVTVIKNAAREPHVVDTANYLNMMGANIKGAGTDNIRITGVESLKGVTYTIIPDQIEAGTFMIGAAITGGEVRVQNIIPRHMEPLSAKLREMGCFLEEGDDYITVKSPERLMPTDVKTKVYPGFPTDLQPQMTALMACANGTGIMAENVWENRFQYVNELKRLGCNIKVEGRVAVTHGPAELSGAQVQASDLRAGAALVLAGLAAKGTTTISNARQINRGYEKIEEKFNLLGGDIQRVEYADESN